MIKFGLVLLIFGIPFAVIGAIALISSDALLTYVEPVICEENETLTRTARSTGRPNEEVINFYCRKDDGGELVPANNEFMLVFGALFLPIALAILLIIVGSVRSRNENTFTLNEVSHTQWTVDQPVHYKVTTSTSTQDVDTIIQTILSSLKTSGTKQLTLKEKLQQLKEAYDAGLITYAEFELRKDRILDEIAED